MWIIFDENVSVDLDKIDKIVIKDGEKGKRICFQKVSSGHLATVHEVTVETFSKEEFLEQFTEVVFPEIFLEISDSLSDEAKKILSSKLIAGAEKKMLVVLAMVEKGALPYNYKVLKKHFEWLETDVLEFSKLLELTNRFYILELIKSDYVSESDAARKILNGVEDLKKGISQPEDLSILATRILVDVGLENASKELADLLHDCFDYAINPTESGLKEIEERAERILYGDVS